MWSCWNSPGGHESTGHNRSADCASGQSLCNDRSCQPVSAFVPVSGSPRLLGSMPPKLHQKSSKYLYHCLSLLSNVAMFSWSPITLVDQRYQEALLPRLQLAPAVPPGTPTQQRLDLLQVIELNGSICRSCWICSNLINLEFTNFKLINWSFYHELSFIWTELLPGKHERRAPAIVAPLARGNPLRCGDGLECQNCGTHSSVNLLHYNAVYRWNTFQCLGSFQVESGFNLQIFAVSLRRTPVEKTQTSFMSSPFHSFLATWWMMISC